jgi:hypothetical protein
MKARAANHFRGVGILMLSVLTCHPSWSQSSASTLSGTVTATSGAAIANAKISAKKLDSDQPATTQSDSSGQYTLPNLSPGAYEVSISAQGFETKVEQTKLTEGIRKTVNITLMAAQAQSTGGNLPNAPSSSKTEPSLQDLGFPPDQTQGNAKQQALLDKRTHMLKIHQRLGLITAIPLIATVVTSAGAGGRSTSSTD